MQVYSESEVKERYHMKDAITAIEESFNKLNQIKTAPRTVIPTGDGAKSMLYMPCVDLAKQLGTIKITSITPENPKQQLPTTQAQIVITNLKNGETKAMLDGSYLTRLRTGALSGIATKYMSRENATTLGMIGTGGMAYEQFLGNIEVRPINTVLLYNRTTEKAQDFKTRILKDYPDLNVQVLEDVSKLVKQADIINCQTPSTQPVFNAEDVQPGTHINGIGSYQPDMKELDANIFTQAESVVVDDLEGAKEESGELIEANENKTFTFEEINDELKTLSQQGTLYRKNNNAITVFKCVGAAYFDLAVAIGAYEKLNQ
ncbi:ornithine cyclodeaminase family protein [Staphylococcus simulans]|uniref:ornithine cyclodeaminase family protein n=1 Tax=Staphylococcus simulans TaxID=1286 RepID=UPI0027FBF258|nr:ornithine cyclodeaminase family protein [Staphylococcus simulans]MDQ7115585.1 ornithine cyclodeaminase family protein [Staphylococcus simulans]MDQ7140748.1 ornithine cyclodeaminase family protein [Staphylococcus simulans]WML96194.1 ornithine cyclodeaminase family protein [Staphylococcus simulans]WMM00006.1 ornithine cyclodeaminase family protein [Staphylococcus simulans]WMM03506.1 ornithine cyclodeaminase family protein [Staphylococcus simulans]